jgi:alpha-1,3-rhamnosyl/mannosyltransferase
LGALVRRDELRINVLATDDVPVPAGVERVRIRRRARSGRLATWEHQSLLPFEAWRHRADVFHNPHPHAPVARPGPWVQTLYDLIPLTYDDPSMAALRARFQRFGPRYAKAGAVIAISRFVADEGIRLLGLRPERVHVAHPGVGEEFRPAQGQREADPPFLLVVSEYQARKGFEDAFAVVGSLADAGYPHRLRLAGRVPPWAEEPLASLVAGASHPERIDVLGFVDDLPALYRAASVVLVPSRCEGFGLPAAEAMASGTPVVAYDNSALPEVIGDGGIVVSDSDAAAMTEAVRRILDSAEISDELVGRGLERAQAFQWEKSAAIHADVYKAVAR